MHTAHSTHRFYRGNMSNGIYGINGQVDAALASGSGLRMQWEYFVRTDVRRKTKGMAHL